MAEAEKKSFFGGSGLNPDIKFENSIKKTSLIYPLDLNDQAFYPDCVCFTIQKRTGVSIDKLVEAGGAGIENAQALWNDVDPDLAKKIKSAKKGMKEGATKVEIREATQKVIDTWKADPKNKDFKPSANMLELLGSSFKTFATSMRASQETALARGKSGANILGSIYLNMPNGITFDEKASWSGQELGFMGKMSKDFVGGTGASGDVGKTLGGAAIGSGGSIVGAAVGAIPSLVSKLGIQGGMFGAAIGAMAAGGPMQKGAEAALGVAQNPYMEMMFSGVGFRAFQFEFIMRPRHETEMAEVAEILRMFRTFTKPTFVEGKLGKSFMDYPMEFQIEFLTSSSKTKFDKDPNAQKDQGGASRKGGDSYILNPFVPQLKNCVCDSVTSNYTPQSIWAAHDQGKPVAVTLGLSFQETELVMAEDVFNKHY